MGLSSGLQQHDQTTTAPPDTASVIQLAAALVCFAFAAVLMLAEWDD